MSTDRAPKQPHSPKMWTVVCLLIVALVLPAMRVQSQQQDALTTRVLSELQGFTDWLRNNNVNGYIGEVGWPDNTRGDGAQWNALADRWYSDADAAGLWVTAWATGEWWGTSYPLADYVAPPGRPVSQPDIQASVLERHGSTAGYLRGINVNGGEFGSAPTAQQTSDFSNANPGSYESSYHYDSLETFRFLASRGIRLIRLPFRWERIQPHPGGELDPREVGLLRAAVDRAHAAGLQVVLDLHNYGAYWRADGPQSVGVRTPIGTREMNFRSFALTWRFLSTEFKDHPGVVGYGLMNEPQNLPKKRRLTPPRVWEKAAQKALDAIRANGDGKLVLVPGYDWSHVRGWAKTHPRSWIRDSAQNFRYEAHHYWDADMSGEYARTYEEEVTLAGG